MPQFPKKKKKQGLFFSGVQPNTGRVGKNEKQGRTSEDGKVWEPLMLCLLSCAHSYCRSVSSAAPAAQIGVDSVHEAVGEAVMDLVIVRDKNTFRFSNLEMFVVAV